MENVGHKVVYGFIESENYDARAHERSRTAKHVIFELCPKNLLVSRRILFSELENKETIIQDSLELCDGKCRSQTLFTILWKVKIMMRSRSRASRYLDICKSKCNF